MLCRYLNLDGVTTTLDKYGRVQPDIQRFPSAAATQGFKKLAAYAHSKGLMFGIHTSQTEIAHAGAGHSAHRAARHAQKSSARSTLPAFEASLVLGTTECGSPTCSVYLILGRFQCAVSARRPSARAPPC